MKKIFKFFATAASFAAVAGGAFLVYKKFFANDTEDFDFDDSFAEDDAEDPSASREYVSINITGDEEEEEEEDETASPEAPAGAAQAEAETSEEEAASEASEETDAE